MATISLSADQIAAYEKDGYLVVRQVVPADATEALRCIVESQAKDNAYPSSLAYPTPGKYTISGNKMANHPGLAAIAEYPGIIEPVECLLGQPAHLTAYVAYVRTPGDQGSGAIISAGGRLGLQ